MRCPTCGRKQSNMPRQEYDPDAAALLELQCERCNKGDFAIEHYFDLEGKEVPWR